MRSSFYLAGFAQFGTVATWITSSGHLGFASAGVFVFFALYVILYVFERGWNEPPEVTANRPQADVGIMIMWTFYPVFFAPAVWSLFYYETWGPAPATAVCLAFYVLSFVFRVRENRAIAALVQLRKARSEPAPETALPTPKLVGLPAHAPVPPGWSPVYVHRPAGRLRDHLVDYRVHVDGARVGTVGEGETFLVCLAPGEHTVQGWVNGLSSRPLAFHAWRDTPLHLILEPGGPDGNAMADQRGKKGDYLRLTQHHYGPQETHR